MIDLTDTDSSAIAAEFLRARRRAGSPAMGMVMTLVVVVDEDGANAAMEVARTAAREHPARLLGVVIGNGRGTPQVDAEIGIGSGASGERALIRLSGEVTKHPESVVLPLLLPDSPVAMWWPRNAPEDPAADPLGRLAQRRITDAAAVPRAKAKAMLTQCRNYAPGNTDLAWTRITGWRALLAAALDQHPGRVVSASVTAERISPSADLLSAWLADRLRIDVDRRSSDGPGITDVVLTTRQGDVSLVRYDGKLATLSSPGQPDRPVALKRRELAELLSEELRRLDPDDVYARTARRMVKMQDKAARRS
ncbi:MAG TPA: glucose-6-phosphate dehydrogenase assembly protein OpcA [Segeticoccus sp.]|uniref:glucose-6-phosphate dehydrogenase assembly protein OpcA n=1 Tax=Segeticoccus sp. TaxID=2706531 RepID=UPI002D806785|nr:glucose-6-phosphate dehydrogenase assembly protein OpcA [Segeticoccus sp.]HET8599314.1 glucose-6-phosphate dehydrogenase assembly protein OpcA [Segeticoccus sp.]